LGVVVNLLDDQNMFTINTWLLAVAANGSAAKLSRPYGLGPLVHGIIKASVCFSLCELKLKCLLTSRITPTERKPSLIGKDFYNLVLEACLANQEQL